MKEDLLNNYAVSAHGVISLSVGEYFSYEEVFSVFFLFWATLIFEIFWCRLFLLRPL